MYDFEQDAACCLIYVYLCTTAINSPHEKNISVIILLAEPCAMRVPAGVCRGCQPWSVASLLEAESIPDSLRRRTGVTSLVVPKTEK